MKFVSELFRSFDSVSSGLFLSSQSSLVQAIVTSVNVCTLVFIIVVGGYLAFKTGWVGYDLPSG